jgi:hypothetical protein
MHVWPAIVIGAMTLLLSLAPGAHASSASGRAAAVVAIAGAAATPLPHIITPAR